ncbi:MAG: formate dehydrogenase accessory sulfurtransferase FdhD [Deltaproteobacteria bacterium]|nr:formate dehydrogenase accessory sulfurtransferase FdhD [Deltaproteobacteria bacterium]
MSKFDQTIKTLKIFFADSNSIAESSAKVIQEVTLAINLNSKPLANIACAGINLDELTIGFLRSERIIAESDEIAKIEITARENRVNVILKNKKKIFETFVKNIASSGARSKGSYAESLLPLSVPEDLKINVPVALNLMDKLLNNSTLHNKTGGTHCSALAIGKNIIALREDIGRHNTIDMLGGYALLQNINLSEAKILTTGRISSEIVYKVWNMGIPVIISHSAPTANAVELSHKANITLIAYVRGGRMSIYSHERRVKI